MEDGADDPERPIKHIQIDHYFDLRVKSVYAYLDKESRKLAITNGIIQLTMLLVSTVATVASVRGFSKYTIVLLAVGTMVQSLEKHFAISTRLEAANRGVQELCCMIEEWKSSEPMQRRFAPTLDRLVEITERAVLELVNAATAGAQSLQTTLSEPEQREPRKKRHGKKAG